MLGCWVCVLIILKSNEIFSPCTRYDLKISRELVGVFSNTISKWIWPNSSLSESFIKTNKMNSFYCHKRNTYLCMNVDFFFSFWWKCVLRNVLCISTFYKKNITRVLVETEPALVFLYLDWRSCSHTGIVHLNSFRTRFPDPTFAYFCKDSKIWLSKQELHNKNLLDFM